MKTTKLNLTARDEACNALARAFLNVDTLETRNSDSLDFSDQAVWNLKVALQRAYEMGVEAAEKNSK